MPLFHRFPQMFWEDIFLGMVVTGGLIMSFYFLTEQRLWNLKGRLPASIICHLSFGLPPFYCSSRIWPVTLVPLWLLWFLCATYIPILLNQTEKEGWVSFVPLRSTKQLNWPEQAGLQLLYVDKRAQRSQKVLSKWGLYLIVARHIKECVNRKCI